MREEREGRKREREKEIYLVIHSSAFEAQVFVVIDVLKAAKAMFIHSHQ